MSALEDLRKFHRQLLQEARDAIARADIVGRFLEEVEGESAPPSEVVYDRTRLDAPPRPAEATRPAPSEQAHGDELELDVESLHVTDDGEKKTFKVKGGAYRKWGVFIWPEVLERDFGIDSEAIKPGLHPFKYRVRILMDGDRPRKVIGPA